VKLHPKKSLGQNFLTDPNTACKIVRALDPQPGDSIIEIGAGTGVLTRHLLACDAEIIAVEIDERATAILDEIALDAPNLRVLQQDILDVDFRALGIRATPCRIIGNLPYYLTSQILFHLFDQAEVIKDAVLMMQKEVAERLTAHPRTKQYGILSVMAQLYSDVTMSFTVPPTVFTPKPRVMSAVLHLAFHTSRVARIRNMDVFRRIVRGTFGKRRKTMLNCLKHIEMADHLPDTLTPYLGCRPEELTVDDFIFLANEIVTHD